MISKMQKIINHCYLELWNFCFSCLQVFSRVVSWVGVMLVLRIFLRMLFIIVFVISWSMLMSFRVCRFMWTILIFVDLNQLELDITLFRGFASLYFELVSLGRDWVIVLVSYRLFIMLCVRMKLFSNGILVCFVFF